MVQDKQCPAYSKIGVNVQWPEAYSYITAAAANKTKGQLPGISEPALKKVFCRSGIGSRFCLIDIRKVTFSFFALMQKKKQKNQGCRKLAKNCS